MFVFDQFMEYSSQFCHHLDLKSKESGTVLREVCGHLHLFFFSGKLVNLTFKKNVPSYFNCSFLIFAFC